MVQMFPFVIKAFEQALGKNLGLARLPQSGPASGPHRGELVPQLGDPEEREEPDGAWEFIKMAVDNTGRDRPRDHRRRAADEQGGDARRSRIRSRSSSSRSRRIRRSRCSTASSR